MISHGDECSSFTVHIRECMTVLFPRLICRAILLLVCGCTLSGAEQVFRIGVENDSAPLSYRDEAGNPAGFSAELLAAMSEANGMKIEIVAGYWSHIIRDFQQGKLDALANVTITEKRREWMDFSISHAYVHGLVYFAEGSPRMRRTADFAGKRMGVLKGSLGHINALVHEGWGAVIVPFDTKEEALEATQLGKTDATIFIRRLVYAPWLEAQGMDWEFVDDIVHEYHFAVHKGDGRSLEKINEALATVRGNGMFDRLYAKWIGPIEPHPIRFADLRPYYLPAALALVVIIGLIVWQRGIMNRLARQKEALRASEERWKFAVEGAGDGVWDWSDHTNEVLLSKRWLEMLGYGDEVSTNPQLEEWMNYVHPEDHAIIAEAQAANARGEREAFSFEHRLRCQNGSWKWVLSRGMVVSRDAKGTPLRVLGTHTDISGLKQAAEDRLVLGKLESTGVLAGGIAHDFNNLLTAIILNLDLARYNRDSSDEFLFNVDAAEKAALAARGLTQQLITFAKGGATVVGIGDMRKLLGDAVPLVLSGSNVRADLSIAKGLWSAEMDEGQVAQVIRILVLNAREAMPAGGVIKVTAKNMILDRGDVRGLSAGEYLQVEVADTGEGIAPEILEKIFDPYFSTKQRGPQKGMGLGLTICHSIMLKHHGMLTVESTQGEGTTFRVYLPATKGEVCEETDSIPPFPERAESPLRILIMDDEDIMRDTLGRTLHQMGHTVGIFSDGKDAILAYEDARKYSRDWDLVLLDLTIPGGLGGRETLAALRVIDAKVRAVVMTGYTNDEIMTNYASVGFKAVLSKPFTSNRLKTVINESMAAK